MKRTITLTMLCISLVVMTYYGCKRTAKEDTSAAMTENPFFKPSTLPFQAPPFDKIKNEDFKPAIMEGMKQQIAEIQQITDNTDAPTVENTLIPLEKSGRMLDRTYRVFSALTSANTNDMLQKVQQEVAPKLAAHQDAIYLNDKLFKRIKTIYDQRDELNLDPETNRLVEYYYQEFVHAGANLSVADKTKLKKLNEEEATLRTKFENKLLKGTKDGALVVSDKADLAGLTSAEIEAAAGAAKSRGLEGKWVLPLQNTTQQPALQSLENRNIREKLFKQSWTRTELGYKNDTRDDIKRIAKIRAEKAELLGFPTYSAWKLEDQMAKNPSNVQTFLGKLVPASVANARKEAADIQSMINETGGNFKLQPWDWNYYGEKVRKARYDLDESQIKPYFELNNVLENGVFFAAHELYGLSFKERHDLPVYNPDVRVFDVMDSDGSQVGLFYADYYKRDNKSGGAWMSSIVGQSKLLGTKPVIYNVANFPKAPEGQPTLLTYDEVSTLFHEFGHALHGFFSNVEYPSLSGTSVARDFVELPSQFNEHWALYPSVFAHYAVHYKTGEPMPKELVEKIKKSRQFNQGYALTELLAAAELDMAWHTLSADAPEQDVDKFEAEALKKDNLAMPPVPPRYRSSYFMHIWGHGYASGYYAYLWSEMLDQDAYEWFKENGGLTRANGDRFRNMILSRGNTEDLATMYRNFRGSDPTIEPLLKARGLQTTVSSK
jgi:peptidyl-dipeptidase Dcp